jgi:Ser/Thr protein kinase RdoA (MazF antagonist)
MLSGGRAMSASVHPNQRPLSSLPPELRRTSVPVSVREWVRRELGAEVVRWRRLAGASTSAVHRLSLADGTAVVLRRYVWRWVLEDEPEVPQREVDALRFAGRHGLAVPDVLAADPDGAAIGDGVPALVMGLVPGTAVPVPDLRALAELAARIHRVDAAAFPQRYFPWSRDAILDAPPTATDRGLWRRALDIWHTQMPAYDPGFLHRDFHPGNVLWKRGTAHVVDWANGCAGPWGCDIAYCRDNLIRLSGFAAADDFLRCYLAMTGAEYDPYWEIASVLEHSPSSFDAARVAISERRLRSAMAEYG